ncbi:MAG: hypothetical protein HWE34_04295 [Methylocystaceae bacterium]|nr:hypothetical protein [Methylocystaceae bacterium]
MAKKKPTKIFRISISGQSEDFFVQARHEKGAKTVLKMMKDINTPRNAYIKEVHLDDVNGPILVGT